jgi:hypothetical protein
MGYDLCITRRKDWDQEIVGIAFEEFVAYVRDDVEFTYPGQWGDDSADWRSPNSGYESWLAWSDGEIYTKNPEPEFIDKMVAISRILGAKVQGDDGEIYRSATETYEEDNADDHQTRDFRVSWLD